MEYNTKKGVVNDTAVECKELYCTVNFILTDTSNATYVVKIQVENSAGIKYTFFSETG